MRITDLLDRRSILLDGAPAGKNDALDQMVELMARSGIFVFMVVGNPWMYVAALLAGTTISTLLLGLLKKNVVQ